VLATRQSRVTFSSKTSRTSAVSATLRPPKNRNPVHPARTLVNLGKLRAEAKSEEMSGSTVRPFLERESRRYAAHLAAEFCVPSSAQPNRTVLIEPNDGGARDVQVTRSTLESAGSTHNLCGVALVVDQPQLTG